MLRGRELKKAKAWAALACAALLGGCAQLPADYAGIKDGGEGVVAFHCRHLDGDDAGMAYFDLHRGLALMELSIGIDMAGRMLAARPLMVGEVYFGSAKVVFSIPPDGGESEVVMFSGKDAERDGNGELPPPKVKKGKCEAALLGPQELEAMRDLNAPLEEQSRK